MDKKEDLIIEQKKHVPFVALIGAELEEVREGYSRLVLREISKKHLNGNGRIHGGLIYTLCDSACGSLMDYYGGKSSTIEGNIQYLNNPKETKAIICEASILKRGNRVSFIEVKVTNQKKEKIAAATFTYYSLKNSQ